MTNSKTLAFLKTPKGYLLLALLALAAVAGIPQEARTGWINAGISVGTALFLDTLFAIYEQRKRITPSGAILTGLIVALVLSSDAPWYVCLLTAAIAIFSKHVLKTRKKPVFNPAAFGLAVAVYLFGSGQSWWGGLSTLPVWSLILVLLAGMLVTRRAFKYPQVFAFLGTYFGLLLIVALWHTADVSGAFRTPYLQSALFLAFFMVTDPPTSPASTGVQVSFGCVAAAVSVADYVFFNGLAFLLLGLLAANGWHAWYARRASSLKTAY